MQETYAAASDEKDASSLAAVSRPSQFSLENLLELCTSYGTCPGNRDDKELYYRNQFASFKSNLKSLDWGKVSSRLYFLSLANSFLVSLNNFSAVAYSGTQAGGSISRDVVRTLYPLKVHPVVTFVQEKFFNPLMEKLQKNNSVSAGSKFGVLPHDPTVSLGYMEDTPGSYLFMSLSHLTPSLRKCDVPFGITNIESQSAFLLRGETLITDPGFIIDYRRDGSGFVRIVQYYGGNPDHPLKTFPLSVCGGKEVHSIFRALDDLLQKEIDGRTPSHSPIIFMATPQTPQENELLEILLLKELSQEKDPEIQKANLLLLEAYGYFEEKEVPKALALEDASQGASAEAAPPLPVPYSEVIANLKKQAEERLAEKFRAEIRAEQESIKQRVIAEAEATAVHTPSKSKRGGHGKGQPQPKTAAAEAPKSEENIDREVKALMKQYRLKNVEKFRNVQGILNLFLKEKASHMVERQRGSHHTIHIPDTGSITIAHHGLNDRVPTARILRDFVAALGSPQ